VRATHTPQTPLAVRPPRASSVAAAARGPMKLSEYEAIRAYLNSLPCLQVPDKKSSGV